MWFEETVALVGWAIRRKGTVLFSAPRYVVGGAECIGDRNPGLEVFFDRLR